MKKNTESYDAIITIPHPSQNHFAQMEQHRNIEKKSTAEPRVFKGYFFEPPVKLPSQPANESKPLISAAQSRKTTGLYASTLIKLFITSGISGFCLFIGGIALTIAFSKAFWPLAPLTAGGFLLMAAGVFANKSLYAKEKPVEKAPEEAISPSYPA